MSRSPVAAAPRAAGAVRAAVHLAVLVAGAAALSWEVIWQLQASLALGVSALGTALTLAATMGGMTVGALGMGRLLRGRAVRNPLRLYGLLELAVGLSGLLLLPGFDAAARLDALLWRAAPGAAPLFHAAAIALLLGPPTIAMGASVPVFGLIARRHGCSIAALYGFNTAGAALGSLAVAFALLPALGVRASVQLLALVDVAVCLAVWLLPAGDEPAGEAPDAAPAGAPPPAPVPGADLAAVFVTGFVTFLLEVAWFRSLRAAFQSTTESFALMLAAVLVPLALGARLVPRLQRRGARLEPILAGAGALALLATPLVERFDLLSPSPSVTELPRLLLAWSGLCLAVLGPPILLLGVALPWALQLQRSPAGWARLYAVNTAGAVAGALAAGWALLPAVGFARTSWIGGAAVVAVAAWRATGRTRAGALALGAAALAVAVAAESGVGRTRIAGRLDRGSYRVVDFHEGPEATVSAVEYPGPLRLLYIDGFEASGEREASAYMAWMGRLPLLLHPDPREVLVICFGTGQTVNGARREGARRIDAVDLNAAVFRMADAFPTNEAVLADPRVTPHVMDGRAWLRRTDLRYDVVTLEPMPPYFSGVNALYSAEFYRLCRERLNPGGLAVQWLPFHLVHPWHAASIAATFREVFPDAALWIDPVGFTGVLVGRRDPGAAPLGAAWPGLERDPAGAGRALPPERIREALRLDPSALARYADLGESITDDNQLLAYGRLRWRQPDKDFRELYSLRLVERARRGGTGWPEAR